MIFILVVYGIIFYVKEKSALSSINNFAQCEGNGYPVMESYPRQCKTPDGKHFVEEIPKNPKKQMDYSDLVRVTNLNTEEKVSSPLILEGEARGSWFFEASFPIKIFDENGTELGVVSAQTQGEWMTTEFVPFVAMLSFSTSTTQTGRLILYKDNPSGLGQHDDSMEIPITFETFKQ